MEALGPALPSLLTPGSSSQRNLTHKGVASAACTATPPLGPLKTEAPRPPQAEGYVPRGEFCPREDPHPTPGKESCEALNVGRMSLCPEAGPEGAGGLVS